jgi:hypothetical protein
MPLHTSWQTHFCIMNEADKINKNLNTFINGMDNKNSENDKINSLTKDPDCIVMVTDDNHKVEYKQLKE